MAILKLMEVRDGAGNPLCRRVLHPGDDEAAALADVQTEHPEAAGLVEVGESPFDTDDVNPAKVNLWQREVLGK